MKIRTVLSAVAVALVVGTAPALAAARPAYEPAPITPTSCIELNHGDWNACNVGNSGRGDLPYRPVFR